MTIDGLSLKHSQETGQVVRLDPLRLYMNKLPHHVVAGFPRGRFRRKGFGGTADLTRIAPVPAVYVAMVIILLALTRTRGEDRGLSRYEAEQIHMGMSFKIVFYANDDDVANRAADAAFARIAQLDAILSDYQADSELSRLTATAGTGTTVNISSDLWTVLERGEQLAHDTNGAFDLTVGPLVKLWRSAKKSKTLPSQEAIKKAKLATGHDHLILDKNGRTARLDVHGMRLDAGGIAAGYAIDEAFAVLAQHGITSALVDASGDIRVGDPPPDRPGWRIHLETVDIPKSNTKTFLILSNAAVTTSGDTSQFVEVEGVRYSHIVDPATGYGLTDRRQVTVIAPDGITADSLATAFSVMSVPAAIKMADELESVSVHVVQLQSERPITHQSSRFAELKFEQAAE